MFTVNEEKVITYKGYSIYRASDTDKDDFEIWKDGKKEMSCETEAAAIEWINDMEESSLNKILNGVPVREALLDFIRGKEKVVPAGSNFDIKRMTAQDFFTASSKFKSFIQKMAEIYTVNNGDIIVQLEFAVDKNDMDSSGVSLKFTSTRDQKCHIELSTILDGKMSTVRRMALTHHADACDLFKSLVAKAALKETDENNIFVFVDSDSPAMHFEYTMSNPTYKKAANESMIFRDNVSMLMQDAAQSYMR